ncbi:MAG: prepilin-type N-terminal cleavage/methylation domain-containing protein, partial [Opitutaceae bacterium]|nr:prepilin-type N-terminal cleavage/methylation domain-containing protein [Opitutaceae bacterium]
MQTTHLLNTSHPHSRHGFTLIELLTVIAIIGILAAIIIPVVGKVRTTAKAARCASNMRQIATALLMAAADSKDIFPRQDGVDPTNGNPPPNVIQSALTTGAADNWVKTIAPYVNTQIADTPVPPDVFKCPLSIPSNTTLTWAMNIFCVQRNVSAITRPSQLVLLRHRASGSVYCDAACVAGVQADLRWDDKGNTWAAGVDSTTPRDLNYAFVDGHVARHKFVTTDNQDRFVKWD